VGQYNPADYRIETFVTDRLTEGVVKLIQRVITHHVTAPTCITLQKAVPGVGATHLLQAAAAAVPGARYVNLKEEKLPTDCQAVPLLCLDDVDVIPEEDRACFIELYSARHAAPGPTATLLSVSQKTMREVGKIWPQFMSRLSWGPHWPLTPPSLDVMLELLRRVLTAAGVSANRFTHAQMHELVKLISAPSTRTVITRAMTLAVVCDQNQNDFAKLVVDASLMFYAMGETPNAVGIAAPSPLSIIRPDYILSAVAEAFQVTVADIIGQRRTKTVSTARHYAMYMIHANNAAITLCEIGNRIGGRDHSTVLYAVNKIKGMCLADPTIRATIDRLTFNARVNQQKEEENVQGAAAANRGDRNKQGGTVPTTGERQDSR